MSAMSGNWSTTVTPSTSQTQIEMSDVQSDRI
jgi:hypothetical protein